MLTDFEPDPMPVHLIHAEQGLVPRMLRSFIEFAAPRLRRILAEEQENWNTANSGRAVVREGPPRVSLPASGRISRCLEWVKGEHAVSSRRIDLTG